ncbi:hypothetical protein BDV96DRAFT_576984 [Lophiotrema nucula]|uniref:Uncharacterized protein n=1 Tax=Lophiotrema nucula TaxID=690887 RepID=A0A6A5Z670_9PLEO|nr:hypothetical protein BDV96DRAFT_576984 [Lophiotrema nucula]
MPADDDLPWTTSRCNRLLRSISSRITTLRKELEIERRTIADTRNGSNAVAKKISPRRSSFSHPVKARKPRGFEKAADPDWMPGAKPKAPSKRTYGGRLVKKPVISQSQSQDAQVEPQGRPGEIAFTPLIARTGNRLQDTPQQGSPSRRAWSKMPMKARLKQVQTFKKQMPAGLAKVVEGLLDAYAKLLLATKDSEVKRRQGARSLAAACLRKMPQYIELEEHFAEEDKQDDNEDRDLSQEIYTHLEQTFEAMPGEGWHSFRAVVRAHGTALLCDAFAEELVGVETFVAVVPRCVELGALDEAEQILWTYLSTLKPLSTPSNLQADMFSRDTSVYMAMVKAFVDHSGRTHLLYDILEYMIAQELLPLEWLATESLRQEWFRAIQVLSDGNPRLCENALRLIETTISAGIGLPDEGVMADGEFDIISKQIKPSARRELREALDRTFSSLLTMLSGIAIASHCQEENTARITAARVSWVLDSLVVGLLQRKGIRTDLDLLNPPVENVQVFLQRAMWIMMASLTTRLGGCKLDSGMMTLTCSDLTQALSWAATQYAWEDLDVSAALSTLPPFVSSAARCSGRPLRENGFEQLQSFIDAMLSVQDTRLPHKLWNIKFLALESSREFAQITNEPEHRAFARQIEKSLSRKGRVSLTHSSNESPSTAGGFRWEEGIGEWVACTPFVKQNIKRTPKKPLRALELLEAPISSKSSHAGSSVTDTDIDQIFSEDEAEREHLLSQDTTFYDEQEPQSSPIKKAPAPRDSPKRKRSSSPMVMVPPKRHRCASFEYFSRSDAEDSSTAEPRLKVKGPRRSGRPRKEAKPRATNLRTMRSRHAMRRDYREVQIESSDEDEDDQEEEDSRDEDENQDEDDDAQNSSASEAQPVACRPRSRRQPLKEMKPSNTSPCSMRSRDSVRKDYQEARVESSDDDDDDDVLLKSAKKVWEKRGGVVKKGGRPARTSWRGKIEVGDSDDELSFQ